MGQSIYGENYFKLKKNLIYRSRKKKVNGKMIDKYYVPRHIT